MDAAHTVRAHAQLITSELLAHYVMIVKQNTSKLYDKIDALDWANVPIAHQSRCSRSGKARGSGYCRALRSLKKSNPGFVRYRR